MVFVVGGNVLTNKNSRWFRCQALPILLALLHHSCAVVDLSTVHSTPIAFKKDVVLSNDCHKHRSTIGGVFIVVITICDTVCDTGPSWWLGLREKERGA